MTKLLKNTKFYTITSIVLVILAIIFDNLNVLNLPAKEAMWIGFVAMTLTLINAGFKQLASVNTDNKTIWINVALFVAFLAGGILNKFDLIPLSPELQGGLRTILIMLSTSIPRIVEQVKSGGVVNPKDKK
jgi:hypothetical protein